MSYHGDIRLGDTIDVQFTTRNTSGVPTTLAGTPVIWAYAGNSVSQVTGGITLTVDFDSITGLHNCRVVASSGNGYATATNYSLVITTGTVGGTSVVGEQIGAFSIENRSAIMPTTAARTLDVSATGEAGVDWANIGSPTTTVNLSGTTVKTATDVEADTADIQTRIPAALVSGRIDASVGAMAANVITATAINADAITDAKVAADVTIASVTGAVGSVTGAVGSVTGNVGGNVTGSVGSVVGAVGSVTGAVGSVTGNVGGNVVGSVGSVTAAVAITSNIKKNQALSNFEFLMSDSTTHAPATGKTVSVTRSIDGGAFAAGTLSAVTEVANGMYAVNFGAGDLNGNVIVLRATATACDDTLERIVTQP